MDVDDHAPRARTEVGVLVLAQVRLCEHVRPAPPYNPGNPADMNPEPVTFKRSSARTRDQRIAGRQSEVGAQLVESCRALEIGQLPGYRIPNGLTSGLGAVRGAIRCGRL